MIRDSSPNKPDIFFLVDDGWLSILQVLCSASVHEHLATNELEPQDSPSDGRHDVEALRIAEGNAFCFSSHLKDPSFYTPYRPKNGGSRMVLFVTAWPCR